jgi:DNA (cytosine-5)-methyltransferase 1
VVIFTLDETSLILKVNKETLRRWDRAGKLKAKRNPINGHRYYTSSQLSIFDGVFDSKVDSNYIEPKKTYKSVELFAGCGGMALGFEMAGIENIALNEIDKWACQSLRENRPKWNLLEGDIKNFNFKKYQNIDIVSGGFPCQAFSYAGKKLGFKDARGTLFYEFARAVKEIKPKICIGENVRGLLNHDGGKTLKGMIEILDEIGYKVIYPVKVLKAVNYAVPQKRERIIIIGVRKDLPYQNFNYPYPLKKKYTLKDALKKGELYDKNVPKSEGAKYSQKKIDVLDLVPQGGYWRDLPENIQREYMQKSFFLGGGKTGMARRISWNEPCLTLTCSPSQKQTERCHPSETRPFTVREYARIQTFPDNWKFSGSLNQQYKQIGNAVPVNLAKELGYSIVSFLNSF